jgi:predicted dehydrogenase
MTELRAGIIGAGFMAKTHIEAVRKSGLGEIIAIAGATEEEANNISSELGIDRAYDNYMDVIRDADVDVIHNCTPNNLHFPINRAALGANKNTISEKPLAVDSREARLLLSAADRSTAVSAAMFNYRHHPVVEDLRAKVQGGELGDISAVHGCYLQDWLLFDTDYNWRVNAEIGGPTRVLADLGSHWLDLAQYVTGQRIVEVMGDVGTLHPIRQKSVSTVGTFGRSIAPRQVSVRVGTEDYASVMLRFDGGLHGVLSLSQVSAGSKNRLFFQVDGSKNSAAWDQEQPGAAWIGHRDGPNKLPPKSRSPKAKAGTEARYPGGEGWLLGVENFIKEVYSYIGEGKKPEHDPATFATFQDGYESVVLTDRILASSRQGRWSKIVYT